MEITTIKSLPKFCGLNYLISLQQNHYMVYTSKVPIQHLMIFISLCMLPACTRNENIEIITDQLAELECKAINL